MSKTELKTKTATKSKSKAKAAPKAKTLFYAATLSDCLTGKYGELIKRFYLSACLYHIGQKTVFPRPRLVGHPLLKADEVGPWLKAREGTSIPAGDKTGQRLFDEMMVECGGPAPVPAKEGTPATPA